MRSDEFEPFSRELKQLCASLGKPYTDPLAQAYWRALKDISLDELQSHVERILLNATRETKFPRPSQLRTTPPPVHQASNDPKLRECEDLAIRNLEELRQKDPEIWLKRMGNNNAASLHRQFNGNIWYDLKERCWRR
jgi:hypothetical protein